MTTKHFKIAPSDVLDVISLVGTWIQNDSPTTKGYVSPLKIQRLADEAEARVICTVPEIYREKICGTINGIIGEQWATAGQTTVPIPSQFSGIISSVRVYKNYPDNWVGFYVTGNKSYHQRNKNDESMEYTLNAATPSITLADPLAEGDSIVLDINYTSSAWVTELVEVTRKLAAYNLLSALPTMSDNISVRTQQLYSDVYGFLARLSGDRGGDKTSNGISTIDSLPMVKTERVRSANAGRIAGIFGL